MKNIGNANYKIIKKSYLTGHEMLSMTAKVYNKTLEETNEYLSQK